MTPEPNERRPYWIFYLEWVETMKSQATGEPVDLHYADPMGPYAYESEAHDARMRYLAGTGWMPSGAHSPNVSDLIRIGPPPRERRQAA